MTAANRWESSTRGAIRAAVVAITVGVVASLLLVVSPGIPSTLHVWGHDWNSTGEACGPDSFDCLGWFGPPPAQPVSLASALGTEGSTPVVLHSLPGLLGWYGLTDAGPKPAEQPKHVYLQVGSDAFVPYVWAHCCMPDW